VPAQQHDDAPLDDVEPGSLLLEGLAEPAALPPLASNKLHLMLNEVCVSLVTDRIGSEQFVAGEVT
jgi:hypothetical protein